MMVISEATVIFVHFLIISNTLQIFYEKYAYFLKSEKHVLKKTYILYQGQNFFPKNNSYDLRNLVMRFQLLPESMLKPKFGRVTFAPEAIKCKTYSRMKY